MHPTFWAAATEGAPTAKRQAGASAGVAKAAGPAAAAAAAAGGAAEKLPSTAVPAGKKRHREAGSEDEDEPMTKK